MASQISSTAASINLDAEAPPVSLRIGACRKEMLDLFDTFVSYNPDYRFEQGANVEIIVMLPTVVDLKNIKLE